MRRLLESADRFKDNAIRRGLDCLNTSGSKESASLFWVTLADHLLVLFRFGAAALPFLPIRFAAFLLPCLTMMFKVLDGSLVLAGCCERFESSQIPALAIFGGRS